jgi:uncharacterized protein (DUF2237 family)
MKKEHDKTEEFVEGDTFPKQHHEQTKNVLGTKLNSCSSDSMTGFLRDGYCNTNLADYGTHVVCAIITDEFLRFTKSRGNDLGTPLPEYQFPGLKTGDRWCLCVLRWKEAYEAGGAPLLDLKATHEKALEHISRDTLEKFRID